MMKNRDIAMTNDECIEVLEHMCNKIGIAILVTQPKYGYALMSIKGTAYNHKLKILPHYLSYTPDRYYLYDWTTVSSQFDKDSNGHMLFSTPLISGIDILLYFVTCFKTFKVEDINLCISNPFFSLLDVMNCRSPDEAKVLCDLHWPNDIADNVIKKIQQMEKTTKHEQ